MCFCFLFFGSHLLAELGTAAQNVVSAPHDFSAERDATLMNGQVKETLLRPLVVHVPPGGGGSMIMYDWRTKHQDKTGNCWGFFRVNATAGPLVSVPFLFRAIPQLQTAL
jgi:hypothetical protein